MMPSARSGDVGDAGKQTDDLLLALSILDGLMAAGGNVNESEASTDALSLTMNSPDMAGVGGRRERDMVSLGVKQRRMST